MLEIKNVTAGYGDAVVLKDVSMEVDNGEYVSVIGPNGAGKTTLLRVLSGLLKPAQGEILFDGERIDGLPAYEIVKRGLAHCPERESVAPRMTVMENLEVGAYILKDERKIENLKQIFELFPKLEERRNQLAGTLSGGERQMLNLGRALMSSPKMLLLDEPSLGIAPIVKSLIFTEAKRINERGIAILLVEQDARLAINSTKRSYLLELGKITLKGASEDFLKDDYVRKAYLGI